MTYKALKSSSPSDFQIKHPKMEYVQVRENTPETRRALSKDSTGIVRHVSLGIIITTTKMLLFGKILSIEIHVTNPASRSREGMLFLSFLVYPDYRIIYFEVDPLHNTCSIVSLVFATLGKLTSLSERRTAVST